MRATGYAGSMRSSDPEFRTGAVLATVFTGTLTERRGTPVERIPTPARLVDWFTANGLAVAACSDAELEEARALREAIHTAATAAATDKPLPASAVHVINEHSARGAAVAALTTEGERCWLLASSSVDDALRVIAADAIVLLSGERDGRMALCASPSCRAPFLDASQSRTRRWCDMNSCGNREKKARFQARLRAAVNE
jgi:predicted RNA-binding Zn ribbon-like protein